MKKFRFGLFFIFVFSLGAFHIALAEEIDKELVTSLKIEANHNLNRLKSLKEEKDNLKIYNNEREKGLGSFLEEQEKWDLQRDRGLAEYRKQKKQISPQENGPEHMADIEAKKKYEQQIEKSRQVRVHTRNQIVSENKELIGRLENVEFGLNATRPRYDLRRRGQNKWVKGNSPSNKTTSSPAYTPPPAPTNFDDFPPPAPDYQAMPQPMDNFEEIPPPPPPVYESYGAPPGTFESGYGDIPPPPPPPPVDYDF